MNAQMPTNVSEMMQQAAQTMEAAMQAGAAMQGEAMRWWTEMLPKMGSTKKMQTNTQSLMNDMMPKAQKNASRYFMLFDNGCQKGMELMRCAMEAGSSMSYPQAQMRMMEFWRTLMGAMCANANELVQINTHIMANLTEMAGRGVAQGAEMGHAAAAAAQPKKPAPNMHSRRK